MKLSVIERFLVQQLIPKEANYSNLTLIRKAREELSFSEEENKKLAFRTEGEGNEARTVWNKVDIEKDVNLGETVTGMIVKELKRLDDAGKLVPEQCPLYEKFVLNKE